MQKSNLTLSPLMLVALIFGGCNSSSGGPNTNAAVVQTPKTGATTNGLVSQKQAPTDPWKNAYVSPSGLIWSDVLPDFYSNCFKSNDAPTQAPFKADYKDVTCKSRPVLDQSNTRVVDSDAIEACKLIGGELPSAKDYASFIAEKGATYLQPVVTNPSANLPNEYWTSTAVDGSKDYSNGFSLTAYAYEAFKDSGVDYSPGRFDSHPLNNCHNTQTCDDIYFSPMFAVKCVKRPGPSNPPTSVAGGFVTSTNSVFSHVNLSASANGGWKDPSGSTWALPRPYNSATSSWAQSACQSLGGFSIPSGEDYRRLISYFETSPIPVGLDGEERQFPLTAQGEKDLVALFSMQDEELNATYWSTDIAVDTGGSMNDTFAPKTGLLQLNDSVSLDSAEHAVICVKN